MFITSHATLVISRNLKRCQCNAISVQGSIQCDCLLRDSKHYRTFLRRKDLHRKPIFVTHGRKPSSFVLLCSETEQFHTAKHSRDSQSRKKLFSSENLEDDGFVLEEEDVDDEDLGASGVLVLLLDRPMRMDKKRKLDWSDLVLVMALVAVVYAVVWTFSRVFADVSIAESNIITSPIVLPWYMLQSVLRIVLAYGFSLVFAIVYAYLAYRVEFAAQFLLLILDILQSIPLLSFLPGIVLGVIYLFPEQRIGEEIAAILLLFTSMAWNLVFGFYQSLCGIPKELHETAEIFRLNAWKRFWLLELPSGAMSLVWNSIISVAGGWFFLISIESFTLGKQDFRIPGLGSFLAVAADDGNFRAIWFGLVTIVTVIVILNYLIWWPLIAWTEKFSFSYQRTSGEGTRSTVLNILQRSSLLRGLHERWFVPFWDWFVNIDWRDSKDETIVTRAGQRWMKSGLFKLLKERAVLFLPTIVSVLFWCLTGVGVFLAIRALKCLHILVWKRLLIAALLTSTRVIAAICFSLLLSVPIGVAIGRNRNLAAYLQPLVQIAASVPATALFPFLILALSRLGGGLQFGSIALMMLGTMWYILFNVIAGAQAIPYEFFEVDKIYNRKSRWLRWKTLILPGIFPYLITGVITAVGGAWNASIVSEYVQFQGEVIKTEGVGAIISEAATTGNYPLLLAGTIVMSGLVLLTNRFVWSPLYRLAQERYRIS
eukprot:jgi/Galph1/5355/GphlegSOOS_G3960.1